MVVHFEQNKKITRAPLMLTGFHWVKNHSEYPNVTHCTGEEIMYVVVTLWKLRMIAEKAGDQVHKDSLLMMESGISLVDFHTGRNGPHGMEEAIFDRMINANMLFSNEEGSTKKIGPFFLTYYYLACMFLVENDDKEVFRLIYTNLGRLNEIMSRTPLYRTQSIAYCYRLPLTIDGKAGIDGVMVAGFVATQARQTVRLKASASAAEIKIEHRLKDIKAYNQALQVMKPVYLKIRNKMQLHHRKLTFPTVRRT